MTAQYNLIKLSIWHDDEDYQRMLNWFIDRLHRNDIEPLFAEKDREFLGHAFLMTETIYELFKKEFRISFGD